ncbi:YdcF family protein [Clostridium senegalense]
MFFLLGLTLFTFIIFLTSYLLDSRKLINGLLFNIFLFSAIITSIYAAFSTQNRFLIIIALIFIFFLLLIPIFGIHALIVGLFINTKILINREGKRFSNLLTLFIAIGLILFLIGSFILSTNLFSQEINIFLSSFIVISLYYFFDVFNFLMISFLYQFNHPKLNQDFIIVLGSGLIGDKVPPLLASRINKAIEFYNKQSIVTTPPKIIFSGGQGNDEKISESLAMQKYAVEKGIPFEDTILEDKSTTTFENMTYSKNIMDNLSNNKYNSIFTTNNFHLFRAALYAKMAGLKSQGIGSKTALYFLPNALIREYIAIVVMHKKRHIIIISLILIFNLMLALIQHYFITPYL